MVESVLAFALGLALGLLVFFLVDLWKKRHQSLKASKSIPLRFGAAIKLKPDYYERYKKLHDAVWEDVLIRMSKSNIRNFTIYYHKETSTMFQHFEWIGHMNSGRNNLTQEEQDSLFKADMEAIARDPVTKVWWAECEPCQEPFSQWPPEAPPPSQQSDETPLGGDWWAPLECLNQCGHWSTEYSSQLRYPNHQERNPSGSYRAIPT
ncbi:L-rhamnose mutarotase [Fragilaria crotonensis]|nr:L-rhamnose mutarotase [Fragilaria crotonensis]